MRVVEDEGLRDQLLGVLTEKYSRDRKGIHVSDLVYCLREVFFRRKFPRKVTETELMFFVDGARRHAVVEELSGKDSEVSIDWEGIKGTVDLINESIPIEIKSTRARKSLPTHYLCQLKYYCVMLGVSWGFLIVLRLTNYERPWEFYRIEFDREEMVEAVNEMLEGKDLLLDAFERDDPSKLPKWEPWKCRYCHYSNICEEIG